MGRCFEGIDWLKRRDSGRLNAYSSPAHLLRIEVHRLHAVRDLRQKSTSLDTSLEITSSALLAILAKAYHAKLHERMLSMSRLAKASLTWKDLGLEHTQSSLVARCMEILCADENFDVQNTPEGCMNPTLYEVLIIDY